MYVPRHFATGDVARNHDLIERHSFGTMIVTIDGRLEATHLPFLLDRTRGPRGSLRAHLARANPSSRAFDQGREALVIFCGPHGYISPDWYTSEGQVPTWNYDVVHAYGVPRALGPDAMRALLDDLSAVHEAGLAPKRPWTLAKLAPERIEQLVRAIVAFEIPIDRLEGKAKLSQNRTNDDVAGAAAALDRLGGDDNRALAALMIAAKASTRGG